MFFFEIFQAEKYRSNLTLQLFIVYLDKITIIAVFAFNMCKISYNTVLRANDRTIAQHRNGKCGGDLSSAPSLTFRGTVSACGKKYSYSIPVEKANSSYRKAIETAYGKKL